MGNGFPVAGVLIHPKFKAKHGMLGTTFGGNHLACIACIAVLDVMEHDQLVENALEVGNYFIEKLSTIKEIKNVRGRGLMLGIEFPLHKRTSQYSYQGRKSIYRFGLC
jgi:acetylornithine aminotransferase